MTIALAALTSCSSDEELVNYGNGEVTEVTISATLPVDAPLSRVNEDEPNIPGKGLKINQMQYAIFDDHGKIIYHSGQNKAVQAQKDSEDHGHYTLKVQLLKQHTYTFYVWASAEDSPYTFNPGNGTGVAGAVNDKPYVTVDYNKVKANDETMDAFFGKHVFKIADTQTADDQYTIILNRPFDQLNLLINDKESIESIENLTKDRKIESVTVSINQAPGRYQRLDLDTFIASDPLPGPCEISATFPNGWEDLVHAGDGDVAHYYYLATCYLLTGSTPDGTLKGGVGTAQEVTDLGIKTSFTDGTFVTLNKASVPIRRNWRTNIWGALLTTDVDVNLRIDFNFIDTYKDGPGADNGSSGPDDGDHSGDDNSNNDDIP